MSCYSHFGAPRLTGRAGAPEQTICKVRAAPVIFGEKDVFLLGATTLEALGMLLDPIRRELKPLPMVLMQVS